MKTRIAVLAVLLTTTLMTSTAMAQFNGPSAAGSTHTVAQLHHNKNVVLGRYVTITGHIVEHLRGDYYTFRDQTGDFRVEIENSVWQNRQINPNDRVRLVGEVNSGGFGRYLWVKSLEIIQ